MNTRAKAGTGSIRPRGPGRWELRVSLGVTDGDRQARSKTVLAATEDDARPLLAAWMDELGLVRPPAQTLGEVIEAWFAHTTRNRSRASNENTRGLIDRYLLPGVGGVRLDDLDPGTLERFYQRCTYTVGRGDKARAVPLSDGTVRHLHYIVRPALRLAKRWKWVADNVAEDLELGDIRRQVIELPAVEDARRLLHAADEWPGLGLFVWLAATTGARRSEVAGLQRGDLDWLNSTIGFNRSLSEVARADGRRGRELIVVPPKTLKSKRTVTVDYDTLALTEHHLAGLTDAGCDDGPHRWLFPDLDRDAVGSVPLRPSVWTQRFRRAAKAAGVDMRLHDLRHLNASILLGSREVTLPDLSHRLGHARTSTTTDIYGHLLASDADQKSAQIASDRLRG